MALTAKQIQQLIAAGHGALVREYNRCLTPLETFRARPDSPEDFDEQTSFLNSKAKFSVCLGGTGSGKTIAAAVKTARYLLGTKPPRERCPFWIIGDTFEQVCAICWDEKLSTLIPQDRILYIDWHKPNRNWPFAVTLKHPDHPKKPGWQIEFKSYTQGRQLMQGRSIGGYWCNEEVPIEIIDEVQGRCRDYDSPGWADFTPIEIISPEWPEKYEQPPEGWQFYHLNTELNTALAPGWARRYLAGIPEDERETRRTGVFATFRGQVFKEFRRGVHVLDPSNEAQPAHLRELALDLGEGRIPPDWTCMRGIDWGYANPLAVIWVARDKDGTYYVFDEHYESQKPNAYHVARINERKWLEGHVGFGRTYCDTADPQQMVEFTRLGVKCTSANKGIGQYPINSRISLLRTLMMIQDNGRPRLYVLAKCRNLISEIRGYHWAQSTGADARERNAQNRPVDFNDHALDAMGYAIYSDAMGVGQAPQAVSRPWQPREGIQLANRRRSS